MTLCSDCHKNSRGRQPRYPPPQPRQRVYGGEFVATDRSTSEMASNIRSAHTGRRYRDEEYRTRPGRVACRGGRAKLKETQRRPDYDRVFRTVGCIHQTKLRRTIFWEHFPQKALVTVATSPNWESSRSSRRRGDPIK
jgi:hypothetical protein